MKKNFPQMLKLFKKHYPQSKTALNFETPIQMLVATMLSAQCTDVRVNKVTPDLFAKYPTVQDFANAKESELQYLIRSINFFRNKTKNILAAAQMIVKDFQGKIPNDMNSLLRLPGIARKTANVVLYNCYGVVGGIVVDTHVGRLSRRLGLTEHFDAVRIEKDLMKVVPEPEWGGFSNMLIDHGRSICKAPKPNCAECFLNKLCPSAGSFDANGKWIGVK